MEAAVYQPLQKPKKNRRDLHPDGFLQLLAGA
jgi:hypothetical protein